MGEGASGKEERPTFTVSSLTAGLKSVIEPKFSKIYVEAEISGWRLYPSGHAYFTLKDSGAQISAVMFASALSRCKAKAALKDGAKVLAYANVTVYPPRGNYQLVVLAAKPVGAGDLMQRYLDLKAKLEAEGLFDTARKRPLPFLPRRIGIVTSEAGAVIHDMCTVLTRRFPTLEIRLFPCLVQGAEAPPSILAGLAYFQSAPDGWKADLLIVARGGGSFENLYCFNDEALVRAVAASRIPTISAVGHETDYTLCDFAADRRAGTPSIAAEIAVPLLSDLRARLATAETQLVTAVRGRGDFCAQRVDQLTDALKASLMLALARVERRLEQVRPRLESALRLCLQESVHRLDRADQRLLPSLRLSLQRAASRLAEAETKLTAYSPFGVLERGYSLTTAADGSVVRNASALEKGAVLTTRLASGSVTSVVASVRPCKIGEMSV